MQYMMIQKISQNSTHFLSALRRERSGEEGRRGRGRRGEGRRSGK